MDQLLFFKNIMGSRKRFLNIVGPRQSQKLLVFHFYNTYKFLKHNTYRFLNQENQKISYTMPTLVLTRVCRAWVMHHDDTPITIPRLKSPQQPR